GVQGAVLNGAKETALEAFIKGRIGFLAMAEIVEKVMDKLGDLPAAVTMDDVFAADEKARQTAAGLIK
ncbi:MAG TPA: 1-deoxy-D-xylulose-5-phosphate reductoisomerase, partial [Sinorhizobium sp.]|nr:1-deoxy-D-xylulose-5-phosphate reductoisomerase [Sinorhizobium sp.]